MFKFQLKLHLNQPCVTLDELLVTPITCKTNPVTQVLLFITQTEHIYILVLCREKVGQMYSKAARYES